MKKQAASHGDPHAAPYERDAALRVAEYDRVDPEQIYAGLRPYLPQGGAAVLDIGAGSGRDAAWLAGMGYHVVAVEPAAAMRASIVEKAQRVQGGRLDVRDGALPALATLHAGEAFDLIVLGAVWQHVAPLQRKEALARMVACLNPGGVLFALLREGPPPPGRKMYRTSVNAFVRLGRAAGLVRLAVADGVQEDMLSRADVRWRAYAARRPV